MPDNNRNPDLSAFEQQMAELNQVLPQEQLGGGPVEPVASSVAADSPPQTIQSSATQPPPYRYDVAAEVATELPIVCVPGGPISITDTATKLFRLAALDKKLFVRGGVVVELSSDESGDGKIITIINPASARSRFEKYARLRKRTVARHGEILFVPTILSEEDARGILHCEALHELPALRGITNCPVFIERGGRLMILRTGFDNESGLWITKGDVEENIGMEDAKRGLLDELLGEFAFATSADKSRAAAQFITPGLVFGRLLDGRPAFNVVEANESQTGKGYLTNITAAIYNENLRNVSKNSGGVGSLDESFDHLLVSGKPLIRFDNVRGKINSEKLESFLTEDCYVARVPYKPGMSIDPRRYVLFLTSNGAEFTTDLANRSNICRLRKRQRYDFRTYPAGDLLAHVGANQPHYLGCIYTIVKEWIRLGKPRTRETRHDFRAWSQSLDYIVQHIMGLAPLMDGHEECRDRTSAPSLSFLRQIGVAVEQDRLLGKDLRASEILGIALDKGIDIPGLNLSRALDDRAGAQAVGHILARVFKDGDIRTVDEYRVRRYELDRDECTHHAVKVYTFKKDVTYE